MQRWFLSNPWTRPMLVFVFAAVKIQKLARGFISRKHGALSQLLSYRRHKAQQRAVVQKRIATSQRQLDKYLTYLDRANRRIRDGGGLSHIKNLAKPAWLDGGYSAWCAARIQACWIMVKPRRRFLYKKRFVLHIAALIVQSAYRNRLEMKRQMLRAQEFSYIVNTIASPRKKDEMQDFAVRRIQLKWRSFCSRRIFSYFRELVCFKLQGAPSDLLKTIIPLETGLFDKAAGVHVRFRLGGAVFPPKIYFKVFTHRPLCDLNAFAPRDYKKEEKPDAYHNNNYEKTLPKYGKYQRTAIRVGAKYFGASIQTTTTDMSTWYHREENNPWRPIASQLIDEVSTPQWQERDVPKAKKPQPFHFSSYKRREEIIRDKKRRKREWMLKAYLFASGQLASSNERIDAQYNDFADESWAVGEHKEAAAAENAQAKQSKDDSRSGDYLWTDKRTLQDGGMATISRLEADLADLSVANESKSVSERFWDDREVDYNKPVLPVLRNQNALPASTDKGIAATLRAHRVEDDDDIDLVDWSAALDFEEYSRSWAAIGTSAASSTGVDKLYRK